MCVLPCPNRLIGFRALISVASVALAFCLSDRCAEAAIAGCRSLPVCGQEESATEAADPSSEWPTGPSEQPRPFPEAGLAEYFSPISPVSKNWELCLSWGAKAGPYAHRLPRGLRHPGTSLQACPHRSLQILLSRWVV